MTKFKLSILTFLTVFVTSSMFISCSNEDDNKVDGQKMKVSDFSKVGEIHNLFLTNVNENFQEIDNITNEQDKIEYVNQFNKDFISSLDISIQERELLLEGLNSNKSLVLENNLIEKSFNNLLANKKFSDDNEEFNVVDFINQLKNNNHIGDNSYTILIGLSNDLKNNYEGTLSDLQLESNVQNYIINFNNYGYDANSGEGEMLASILAISISSIEWWKINPSALDNLAKRSNSNKNALIAPWLAADLVGGLISGVTAATGQAIVNGEVDFATVGWSALGGAVAASTGAVGRIVKWFL